MLAADSTAAGGGGGGGGPPTPMRRMRGVSKSVLHAVFQELPQRIMEEVCSARCHGPAAPPARSTLLSRTSRPPYQPGSCIRPADRRPTSCRCACYCSITHSPSPTHTTCTQHTHTIPGSATSTSFWGRLGPPQFDRLPPPQALAELDGADGNGDCPRVDWVFGLVWPITYNQPVNLLISQSGAPPD